MAVEHAANSTHRFRATVSAADAWNTHATLRRLTKTLTSGPCNSESKKSFTAESPENAEKRHLSFFAASAIFAMEPYSTPDLVILSQWRPFVLKSPDKMRLRLQEHLQKLDINNKLSHGSAIRSLQSRNANLSAL
jgi:hypothetical protein